jgi:hypothetical protein
MPKRQHVAGLKRDQIARGQCRLEQRGHGQLHATQVGVQPRFLIGARLAARALPALREGFPNGFDRGGGNTEVDHPAGLGDANVEHQKDHDLGRPGDLQHLWPRLTSVDAEGHVGDRLPRLGEVVEHELDYRVDDVLFDLGERAIGPRGVAGAAKQAIDHRERH